MDRSSLPKGSSQALRNNCSRIHVHQFESLGAADLGGTIGPVTGDCSVLTLTGLIEGSLGYAV